MLSEKNQLGTKRFFYERDVNIAFSDTARTKKTRERILTE